MLNEYGSSWRLSNKQHTYTVVGPLTFEQAKKYGLNSCSDSKICYTQGSDNWDSYLDEGNNELYIFLRDDWKDIPEIHTECKIFPDHPEWTGYDDYGLSMLFVIVNPGLGRLMYCNTRWNHGGDYKPEFGNNVDHVLTVGELKQIVGEELINQIITENEFFLQFDDIEKEGDNLFWVEKNNKENYIVTDGNDGYKLVYGDINNTDEWFDGIWKAGDWFRGCKKDEKGNQKWNYVDING